MPLNQLPPEAIVDGRVFADEKALHALLTRLRREDPMPFINVEGFPKFWLVTRHADIVAIENNPVRFINAPSQAIMPLVNAERTREITGGGSFQDKMRNLVAMDGDEHKVYRAITQSRFLGKALVNIRADVERLAKEFVDRMEAAGGACDFTADVAVWYPLRVIMTILCVPPEDEALMLRLTQQVLTGQDPELGGGEAGGAFVAAMELFKYFMPIIAERRANPRDDIASAIVNATIDGKLIADRDVFGYFLIIATAGHDTTSYSLAGGLLALLQNPDQLRRLREDPALMLSAVEEMIRWSTPVRHFVRTATEDSMINGKQVKTGDRLMMCYVSANRDEAEFEDPFAFRIDRRPNRHLAFGTGPHICLGQHLARMELQCFLRELLDRVEHIELAGEPRFVQATFVGGVKNLPIRYRFRRDVAA
jgi:cytochrome P450